MGTEEAKITNISTNEKDSPGTSNQGDSDKEWQKTEHQVREGTFDAVEGHHFYRPIDSYEGLHRWDPEFEWTEDEEKKIVRKVILCFSKLMDESSAKIVRLMLVFVHLHVLLFLRCNLTAETSARRCQAHC
jgi:hypothetical protein